MISHDRCLPGCIRNIPIEQEDPVLHFMNTFGIVNTEEVEEQWQDMPLVERIHGTAGFGILHPMDASIARSLEDDCLFVIKYQLRHFEFYDATEAVKVQLQHPERLDGWLQRMNRARKETLKLLEDELRVRKRVKGASFDEDKKWEVDITGAEVCSFRQTALRLHQDVFNALRPWPHDFGRDYLRLRRIGPALSPTYIIPCVQNDWPRELVSAEVFEFKRLMGAAIKMHSRFSLYRDAAHNIMSRHPNVISLQNKAVKAFRDYLWALCDLVPDTLTANHPPSGVLPENKSNLGRGPDLNITPECVQDEQERQIMLSIADRWRLYMRPTREDQCIYPPFHISGRDAAVVKAPGSKAENSGSASGASSPADPFATPTSSTVEGPDRLSHSASPSPQAPLETSDAQIPLPLSSVQSHEDEDTDPSASSVVDPTTVLPGLDDAWDSMGDVDVNADGGEA